MFFPSRVNISQTKILYKAQSEYEKKPVDYRQRGKGDYLQIHSSLPFVEYFVIFETSCKHKWIQCFGFVFY